MSVIVIEFMTLDGVVSDPDGSLIDEHRLLTFPAILGTGQRLFPQGRPPADLDCLSAERVGAAVLARYGRAAR